MRNWPQTVLSQYSNSPHFMQLLGSLDDWLSPDANLEDFYRFIWNIRPVGGAEGYGLDVWGRIVGVSRILKLTSSRWFGFRGNAPDRSGFNQDAFWDGNVVTTNYYVTDEVYRRMIFAKAAKNITNGSVPAINAILMMLFPNRGNAYVIDGANGEFYKWFGFGEARDRASFGWGPFMSASVLPTLAKNMTLTYVFEFVLLPYEIAIVTQSGVLPKPTGVKAFSRYLS